MRSDLFTVIPNWSLKADTLACIASLVRAGQSPEQIIVVDNGSTDGSIEALRAEYGQALQIVANPKNLGFAAGSNQGAEAALARGAEWVFLLNNDTLAPPDFFQPFEQALAAGLPYQIYGPAILYHADPDRIWHMGSYRLPGTLIYRNRHANQPYDPRIPEVLPVQSICGTAMWIHRSVIEQVGLFDPELVAYWEEVEFCRRAEQAGFKIAVLARARLLHKVAITAGRQPARSRYLQTRNQLHFYCKYARGLQKPLMLSFFAFKLLAQLLVDGIKGRGELLRPTRQGLQDGCRDFHSQGAGQWKP